MSGKPVQYRWNRDTQGPQHAPNGLWGPEQVAQGSHWTVSDAKQLFLLAVRFVETMIMKLDYACEMVKNRAAFTTLNVSSFSSVGFLTPIATHTHDIYLVHPMARTWPCITATTWCPPSHSQYQCPVPSSAFYLHKLFWRPFDCFASGFEGGRFWHTAVPSLPHSRKLAAQITTKHVSKRTYMYVLFMTCGGSLPTTGCGKGIVGGHA